MTIGTYNALSALFRVIRPGPMGRITRFCGESALQVLYGTGVCAGKAGAGAGKAGTCTIGPDRDENFHHSFVVICPNIAIFVRI